MLRVDKDFQYTQKQFDKAVGTKGTFLSNLWQLKSPIVDTAGREYWNSEGYYMSQRVGSDLMKDQIARGSKISGQESRKARNRYPVDTNEERRVKYMIDAVTKKFDANLDLQQQLFEIKEEIIEKNYWHDTLFGVDDKTLKGANILGRVLMGYRDLNSYL